MLISPVRLFELLLASGVQPASVLEPFCTDAQSLPPVDDAAALAQLLVDRQLLTPYQAEVLLAEMPHPLVYGKNIVVDRIGGGGMGQVFLAVHSVMQRQVAVKVLNDRFVDSHDSIERFLREVRAAARLQHPHIVTAFDADRADGRHYLVMEYVNGRDLGQIAADGPLPVDQALDYISQGAQGLQYAHSQGVIHRDIKPANLLLSNAGVVKVLDLGIARIQQANEPASDETVAHLTVEGMVMGTVDFMAPEQAMNSAHADARSDIYSLGCSLFSLLTGKPAFHGNSIIEKIFAHRGQPVPQLDDAHGPAARTLNQLLRNMLAKEPDHRYQTMSHVIEAIAECRRECSAATSQPGRSVQSSPRTIIGELDGGTVAEHGETLQREKAPGSQQDRENHLQRVTELLENFVAGRAFRDHFIDLEEEDAILRKGCDEGLPPELVRDFLRVQCEQRNWTIQSDLSVELLAQLEQTSEGVNHDAFQQVVAYAAGRSMPRKQAIEHCLTLILDHEIPVIEEATWFNKLVDRYGL
ncbi:serine/threonine-protein kinase [Lignipirellula cremea]|uniref:Serine/threonine-protein kinase PknB n=1 Tax=Lignipirellula cremea TaxID=2528010 RepID=A0A518DYD5_9BACT|nr:serine/threonine-protein kinase [Lignipirellula cremea]QDU96862.1 Serine/threonine-protein kinase PknB [Lignipirellula cremea]